MTSPKPVSNPLVANISLLFRHLPMALRFQEAARYGFQWVEIQFPYDWPAEDLKAWADQAGVRICLINLPAGSLLEGGPGLSCHAEYQAVFFRACQQGLEYARVLDVRCLNVLAGNLSAGADPAACFRLYSENIRYAAELMMYEGIQVTFEAINDHDMPDYLMSRFDQMLSVYRTVGHPNALMQYDIYHMAMMDEPIDQQLVAYAGDIGHIQFADVPGRGAPGTGTLDFAGLFQLIHNSGYSGAVSAEYRISGVDAQDYGWLQI